MLDVRHKQVTPIRLAHNQPHLSVRFHHLALTDMRVSVHDPRDHFPYYFIQNLNIRICLNRALDRLEVGELLKNRGLGDDSLVDEAANGDHGKAGVLELGELISPEGRLVSREVERVEAEVTRGTAIGEHGARGDLAGVAENLNGAEGEEDLPQATGRDSEESLGSKLVVEARKRQVGLLLNDEAESAEHGNTAMLQLSLTEPLQVEIVGEAERVKANVAGKGSIQPGRAGKERHGDRLILHAHA
mmetsp:Transcript_30666/g.64173  ORF Transcript_30666/g.64173 Transcript_30666/m.64173 type:complete len:245 (-) Transcript_30666:130-864(-)